MVREEVPTFDEYPFSLPAVRELFELSFHPAVTFLVGENGSGKSTLLEAIAVSAGFNPEGGSRNFAFSTRASHSDPARYLRLSRGYKRPKDGYFLRAESFYNVASEIDRLDEEPGFRPPIKSSYGGKSLHAQSHGESFMALLTERLRGAGLYILDEPEAALSPSRQMAALARNTRAREEGRAVHHRDALADPHGVPERPDLPARWRHDPRGRIRAKQSTSWSHATS